MHKTNYVCQCKESDYEDTWIEEASREANPEELNEEIEEAEENEEVEEKERESISNLKLNH